MVCGMVVTDRLAAARNPVVKLVFAWSIWSNWLGSLL